MSLNPVISETRQYRSIVGTLEEALEIARTRMVDIDAWAGATISINPVMRDHQSGTYQWEVMVSGIAMELTDPGTTSSGHLAQRLVTPAAEPSLPADPPPAQ